MRPPQSGFEIGHALHAFRSQRHDPRTIVQLVRSSLADVRWHPYDAAAQEEFTVHRRDIVRMRAALLALLIIGVLTAGAQARPSAGPVARAANVCADYDNQAAAQRAADTVDADGDGIFCE